MNPKPLLVLLVSLCVTWLVMPGLARIAGSIGLVDAPSRRKIHTSPRPLVGGIGMMFGVALACLLFVPLGSLRGFYAGLVLLAIVGFMDDYLDLNHRLKFGAQILAALAMIYFSGAVLHSLGDLLGAGPIRFNQAAVFLTVFSTVGVINAVNMLDGSDGLAGGVSLVAFAAFAVIALQGGRPNLLLISLAFIGALLAFLRFNWHPAALFMGDSGSLAIGFALTYLSVALSQGPRAVVPPVVPLLILAVPIVDTLTVMTRRMLHAHSPFLGDRTHFHHMLLRFGMHQRSAAAVIILKTAAFATIGVWGAHRQVPEHVLFGVFMAYFAAYFGASFFIKKAYIAFKRRGNGLRRVSLAARDCAPREDLPRP